MKTKKVVVGAIAATMLSLSVCSIAPASFAAGETVQISVSKEKAKAGEQFTVNVSMADIPSTGLQAVDFAIKYDSSLITIDSVKAGKITETGAEEADGSFAALPLFDSAINKSEGTVNLIWSTQLDDASYWIKEDGVFCTITGTVAAGTADGTIAKLEVVPTDRETFVGSGVKNDKVSCGYKDGDVSVEFDVKISDGSVTVGSGTAAGLRGDANCDKEVNLADAVLVMQYSANPDKYGLNKAEGISDQGYANADVVGGDSGKGGDGVTNLDALQIQKFKLGLVTEL